MHMCLRLRVHVHVRFSAYAHCGGVQSMCDFMKEASQSNRIGA